MPLLAIHAGGVKGARSMTIRFSEFQAEVENSADSYAANKSLDWSNTLLIGKAPPETRWA